MSCSRDSSAIDLGPRSDASTILGLLLGRELPVLAGVAHRSSRSRERPSSERLRTEPRRLRRLASTRNQLTEPSTTSRGPRQNSISPRKYLVLRLPASPAPPRRNPAARIGEHMVTRHRVILLSNLGGAYSPGGSRTETRSNAPLLLWRPRASVAVRFLSLVRRRQVDRPPRGPRCWAGSRMSCDWRSRRRGSTAAGARRRRGLSARWLTGGAWRGRWAGATVGQSRLPGEDGEPVVDLGAGVQSPAVRADRHAPCAVEPAPAGAPRRRRWAVSPDRV
jgi:hypothetical protein